MFIHDYINKLETDFKELFPDKVPLVVDDAANFIDGKYIPKDNEFIVIINTGNATIEKIQNIKSFSSSIYLYVYIPFTERDTFQEELVNYLVEQSDNDTLYPVGEYTAGFAFNTPSCDGKAKKINGKDYALYIVMGNANYIQGNFNDNIIFSIDDQQLNNVVDMSFNVAPVTEPVNAIGKRFASYRILYDVQNITLNILVDCNDTLHKSLINEVAGLNYISIKKIKIKTIDSELEFNGVITINYSKKQKTMNFISLTILR